eukprot:4805854-Pleurochrysis_carterae.AAC.1
MDAFEGEQRQQRRVSRTRSKAARLKRIRHRTKNQKADYREVVAPCLGKSFWHSASACEAIRDGGQGDRPGRAAAWGRGCAVKTQRVADLIAIKGCAAVMLHTQMRDALPDAAASVQ